MSKKKKINKKLGKAIQSHDGVTAYTVNKLQWINNLGSLRKEIKRNKQFKKAKKQSNEDKPKLSLIDELKEELNKSNE